MSTGYDYTQMPVGDGLEDFILPNAVPVKSAEEIGQENGFRDIPPGHHVLEVTGYEKPTTDYYKVNVGGKFDQTGKLVGGSIMGFQGIKLQVKLSMVGDKGANIRDFFTAAPADPAEHRAYFEGIAPDARPGSKGGFHANKFYHFLGAMGIDIVPGQPLPPEALNLRKWIGRQVLVTVVAGKGTYTDKQGNEQKRGPQIKMFSYRRATDAVIAANGANGHGNGAHGNGANGHAAQRPAALAVNPAALPQHSAPAPAKAEKFDPLAGI